MSIIVFPPTIDWDWMMQRHQQLALQFSLNGYEVYYFNRSQRNEENISRLNKNLNLIHNKAFFTYKLLPLIKQREKKIIVWSMWPVHVETISTYAPDYVVFDYIDDFSSWDCYLAKMVNNANLLIASSKHLQRNLSAKFPNRPCFLIPNGCDLAHFDQFNTAPPEKPSELKGHQGPVLTYMGAWAPWVDQNLIKALAEELPQALIQIIGVSFGIGFKNLPSNVRYFGHKPYFILPSYLYYSDACLIPFKINNITIATNPVKMYEYLAAGKPVISTDLPEARNIPYVFIGEDVVSFIQKLKEVLAPSFKMNKAIAQQFAKKHIWLKRFQEIDVLLKTHLLHKRK